MYIVRTMSNTECYETLMKKCKSNNPQKKVINIEDYFENDVLDKKKFEDDLYKYKDNIDCDEFLKDFFSKIQKDLPAEVPVNIPNTEHNVNEFINICNNDFENCFERLKGIWEILKKYINSEVKVSDYHNIFTKFPKSNDSQKSNKHSEIINKTTTEVIVNSQIKNMKETDLVFKNIKTEIQQIISYISHLFIFFSSDLTEFDNKKLENNTNQVNVISNNFTFINKENHSNYVVFLQFIQEIIVFLKLKMPKQIYRKIRFMVMPIFMNIKILHFSKQNLVILKEDDSFKKSLAFFKTQLEELNDIKKGGKSRKKKTKNSKTNKKRRHR